MAASHQKQTRDITYIAMGAVLITVCAWISIPVPPQIPFTLQTLGVFLTVGLLGGRRGTVSVALYLLMGAIGLPVFSRFTGGFGVLLSATGGYAVGFLFAALLLWGTERLWRQSALRTFLCMVLTLAVCYAFGTAWYMVAYASGGLISVLGLCVVPYIVPDLIKAAIATTLIPRLKPHIK